MKVIKTQQSASLLTGSPDQKPAYTEKREFCLVASLGQLNDVQDIAENGDSFLISQWRTKSGSEQ